jgi:hypothetical protein
MTIAAILLASFPARAQYMSFFGDSTWEYHVTCISQPPIDYVNTPSEEPNLLGVYCVTFLYRFQKDKHAGTNYWNGDCPAEESYISVSDYTVVGSLVDWNALIPLAEDTVHGRLYTWRNKLICDMSLSEGDTFKLDNICNMWSSEDPVNYFPWDYDHQLNFDIYMLVDSVRHINGRKVIFLSLIDHQDDYFFGTGSSGLLSDYHLSIRFIEGIGPTYGFHDMCEYPASLSNPDAIGDIAYYYFYPWLPLLQCMYKDDSLVYLAHEDLGCVQTCMGNNTYIWEDVPVYPQAIMNLYPNPATQYVVLDMSTGEELDGSVVITDMLGRQCRQQKAAGTSCQISVSDLPTGMYFLTYTDGKMKVTRKFLKE